MSPIIHDPPPLPRDLPAFAVSGHPPVVAHFYESDRGALVAAIVRFAPGTLDPNRKTFRAFRAESGAWTPGIGDLELPLYRLAESPPGGDQPTFVVEGEKCVDALMAIGLPATTNAFGANKWLASHTAALAGRHVVVIPDNDPPGRSHALSVARNLHGVAASVRVLTTPGAEERSKDDGFDVADWVADGGTAELLSGLAASAVLFDPATECSDWPEPTPLGDADEPTPIPLEEALPPRLAALAQGIADCVQIDPAVSAVVIPAVLSVAVGSAYRVQVSRSYREPNLSRFVLWSKPSGERGSQTFRHLLEPLESWMNSRSAACRRERKRLESETSVKVKRAEYLLNKAAKEPDPFKRQQFQEERQELCASIPKLPRDPVLFMSDITPEALVRSMAEQGGSMGILSADARHTADALLGRYRADGKTDDSVHLRAHGGDPIDRGRIGNVVGGEYLRIPRPSLGMALALQPDKIDELGQRSDMLASGFLARCNLFAAPSRVGTRIETGSELPLAEDIRAGWAKCICAILEARLRRMQADPENDWEPVTLVMDDDAMRLRREFANEIERRQAPDGDLSEAASFASKCAGEAARLAGLLHLAELAYVGRIEDAEIVPITADLWRIAEAHQRWQLAESLRLLSLAQEGRIKRLARRVLNWAVRRGAEASKVSPRDLVAARIPATSDEARQVMALLVDLGWARPTPDSKPGHEHWVFRPDLFGGAS